jgi:methyl-accepting chemotaxis protein
MKTVMEMQTSLRHIVSQVRGASHSIANASGEIAHGADDLSARTEQSAANLEETASAMEQIAETVHRNEETVDSAAKVAISNALAAERGGHVIDEVVRTMQAINSSSSRISDIIATIDGIAFQTNILALNAAVEAARAGDQGRGFAVVASEVRALAQRSSAAAKEIKVLITSSVEQVEGGMRVVKEAGDTIGEVVATSKRVHELLAQVAISANEQSAGVKETTKAVQQLDGVTQQNAALVEQTAAAAGALKDQAKRLVDEVAQFQLPA